MMSFLDQEDDESKDSFTAAGLFGEGMNKMAGSESHQEPPGDRLKTHGVGSVTSTAFPGSGPNQEMGAVDKSIATQQVIGLEISEEVLQMPQNVTAPHQFRLSHPPIRAAATKKKQVNPETPKNVPTRRVVPSLTGCEREASRLALLDTNDRQAAMDKASAVTKTIPPVPNPVNAKPKDSSPKRSTVHDRMWMVPSLAAEEVKARREANQF